MCDYSSAHYLVVMDASYHRLQMDGLGCHDGLTELLLTNYHLHIRLYTHTFWLVANLIYCNNVWVHGFVGTGTQQSCAVAGCVVKLAVSRGAVNHTTRLLYSKQVNIPDKLIIAP
jgi:hypothetical protein